MMSPRPVTFSLILVCALSVAAAQQVPAEKRGFLASKAVPRVADLRQEPNHRLVFENHHLRAFRLDLPPGAATARHPHAHAWLMVALDEGEVVLGEGARAQRTQLRPGQMQVVVGDSARQERNPGPSPFRSLAIELRHGLEEEEVLCGLGAAPCQAVVETDPRRGGYSVATLFETSRVRVRETVLDAGAGFAPTSIAGEYLVVPLNESRLREQVGRWIPTVRLLRPGQVEWEAAGERTLLNVGDQPARFLTIECKGGREISSDAR